VSNAGDDMAGSAARQNEQTGGNVPAKDINLPFGGDAARRAESDGERTNEELGIRTAPRGQYRSSMQLNLPMAVGARMVAPDKPAADLSQRRASDYLPPHLKAQLIAQGRLSEDGSAIQQPQAAAAGGVTETRHSEQAHSAPPSETPERGVLASLTRFFTRLFR